MAPFSPPPEYATWIVRATRPASPEGRRQAFVARKASPCTRCVTRPTASPIDALSNLEARLTSAGNVLRSPSTEDAYGVRTSHRESARDGYQDRRLAAAPLSGDEGRAHPIVRVVTGVPRPQGHRARDVPPGNWLHRQA